MVRTFSADTIHEFQFIRCNYFDPNLKAYQDSCESIKIVYKNIQGSYV